MNKVIAFYDPYITGHHVEYIYHLIKFKKERGINATFIFYVNREFDDLINELIKIENFASFNIEIVHIEDIINISGFQFEQTLGNYKIQLLALAEEIKLRKIEHCVFMYLDNAMQIALSSQVGKRLNCRISGIVLNPYGGFGKGIKKYYYSIRKMLQNYVMMSNRQISAIYIIIGGKTTMSLNLMHFTNKFLFVSDPILENGAIAYNSGKETNRRLTFLLFGSLNRRKGIFKTLIAVNSLETRYLNRIKVIFAGKISESDKEAFIAESNKIKAKDDGSIKIIDKFISYEEIPVIFNEADYILLPYDATQASSGILGHAAYYGKPIIGQGGGTFGRHVSSFQLGLVIKNLTEFKLTKLICSLADETLVIDVNKEAAKKYINYRSGDYFASTIINSALR